MRITSGRARVALLLVLPAFFPTEGSFAEDHPAAPAVESERATGPGHKEDPVPPPREPVRRESQARSPRAIVMRGLHRSIQVNVDAQQDNIVGDAANEPTIAIDPTDPDVIVIGWRHFRTVSSSFREAGYAYTSDGGETWTFPGVLKPGQFGSDPVLAADSAGNFFYYSLSSPTSGEFFISTDGGVHWTGPIAAPAGEKNWLTIDANDFIYTIWNSLFTCCAPGTDFARSTNGAASFDGPWVLPQHPKWGTLDFDRDGRLYIVGSNLGQTSHVILRTDNASNASETPTFPLATSLNLGGVTRDDVPGGPNPDGIAGQVWIAVDRSGGLADGNVYVLGSVDPPNSDPMDVHLVRSTSRGLTWSAPVAVNDNPGTGSYQWFGTLSVSPEGRLDVVWNDTRSSVGPPSTSELYYAWSTDAGVTFSAGLPVSPAFDSTVGWPQQNKLGDYYHMVSTTTHAALAYAATFNGEQDVYFLRVGDCNANGAHDSVDLAAATSADVNTNRIPDECEPDCNDNDVPDSFDITTGASADCNANVTPDECELASGEAGDCDGNGLLDECQISFDLETDPGFVVGAVGDNATMGQWVRLDPVGTPAQAENDHTPGPGVLCFITGQNAAGSENNGDVDNGKTTLISPVLDLTAMDDPHIGYWRWYWNAGGTDVFVVDISANGGLIWKNVETVGPAGHETSGGWFYHEFRVADLVTPTANVRLRFVAADLGPASTVEAAIDDLVLLNCASCLGPAPQEVQDLGLGRSSPTVAVLSWDAEPDAATYNVYRGLEHDGADLGCFLDGLTATTVSDDGQLPPPGEALFHIVTAANCAGESPFGTGLSAPPCP